MRNLQVNGERLWASLMELARIGATAKGGMWRLPERPRSGARGAALLGFLYNRNRMRIVQDHLDPQTDQGFWQWIFPGESANPQECRQ